MVQRRKSFGNPVAAKYFYIGGDTSQGKVFSDEEMEAIVDFFEKRRTDLRVYKLDANYVFSDPNYESC